MERRTVAVLVAAAIAVACDGGSGSTPAAPSTPGVSAGPTKVAQLDASNFDTAVLAAAQPALVEFHSPT